MVELDMELMEGGNLADLMYDIQHSLFSESALLVLLTDCARGLAHLHNNIHVAHFDIKPANILLDSARRRAKLADFGLALNPDETSVDYPRGTFRYMPPELYSSNRADYRVDVWSLGLSFYEFAAGKHPFHIEEANLSEEEKKIQLRAKILSNPVPELTSRFFQISNDLVQLLAHMLEKNKEERPLIQEILESKIIRVVTLTGIKTPI